MIYWIGRHSKRFRRWYFKKYNGKWLWGLWVYIIDGHWEDYDAKVSYVYDRDKVEMMEKDLDKFLEKVFS